MAGPITWHNVGQANFGDASNFMQLSAQQANQAFTNAGNRAKETEQKAIANKTNSLLSQLGSIQDEDTLNAFKSTINLNDPDIDSNAIVNAFGEQSKNILNRNQTMLGMDATRQNIAASKAGVDLNTKQFEEQVAQNDFSQDLALKQEDRATKSANLNNQLTGLNIIQQQQEMADADYIRKIEAATSEAALGALKGETTVGQASTQILAQAAKDGKLSIGLAASQKLTQQLADTYNLNPQQKEDLLKANSRFDNELVKLENQRKAAETNLINKKYNGKAPQIPKGLDEQIDTNATPQDALNSFVQDIAAIDKDAAEAFATQSYTFSGTDNQGYAGVLRSLNDESSSLYTAFREGLKDNKVSDAANTKIDPLLLKAGLKAVSPVGQAVFDGIDLKKLGKTMAKIQKDRKTYEQYLQDVKSDVQPTVNKIIKVTEQKGRELERYESRFKQMNQKSVANYLGSSNPADVNLQPTYAEDAAQEFLNSL